MRFFEVKRWVLGCVAFLFACGLPVPVGAQEPVEALKEQLRGMQQEMGDLMKRIEELEQKKAEAERVTSVEQSVKAIQESPSILNPSIGMAIDTTFESRPDTDGEFNLRSVELGLSAEIDPYGKAWAFINATEGGVEVEEAAVQTTALPIDITAGQFFADFGRLPQFHEHELPFVKRPLSITRMIDGESLGTGVQWRFLFPTPFYLAFTGGVFNEIGHSHAHGHEEGEGHAHEEGEGHAHEEGEEHEDEEHAHEEGEEHEDEEHAHEEGEEHEGEEHENEVHADEGGSRSFKDLTYLGRLHAFFDLSQTWNLELGTSLAHSPRTEMEEDSQRSLFGTDVTIRHRPLVSGFYEGFTVAGEWFVNRQESHDGTTTARGGYAYANWDVNPELPGKWSMGVLLDSAQERANPSNETVSLSPYITWSPSEFNRLRLQYTHGWDDGDRPQYEGSQVFLQWTTVIGSHTHGFRQRH